MALAKPMKWDKLLSSRRMRELEGGTSSTGDHRSQFRRDFDRIVFSSPVRRLQDKAQVFALDPNDAVRTRLTHSWEVSSVAHGIAEKACQWLVKSNKINSQQASVIETIASTVGLVHDLGNPPFGHFGEDAIQEWFSERFKNEILSGPDGGRPQGAVFEHLDSKRGETSQLVSDFLRYEGNARTIRILCNLQILADRSGMNLTAGTLAATLKYVAASHEVDESKDDKTKNHTRSKPGYFFAEQEAVDRIRLETGIEQYRHPIAFLVEAADDCVYSLCDIEDGIKKRVLSWQDFENSLQSFVKDLPTSQEKVIATETISPVLEQARKSIENRLRDSQLELHGPALDDAHAQMFRVHAASHVVDGAAASFQHHFDNIMLGQFMNELVAVPESGDGYWLVKFCKYVGRTRVYNTRENIELELRGRQIIRDLMSLIWIGLKDFNGKVPKTRTLQGKAWSLLSDSYRQVFLNDWKKIPPGGKSGYPEATLKQYYKLLLLADYVAGMTDTFASNLHASLFNG